MFLVLLNGSAPPNGSAPNPGNGSTFGLELLDEVFEAKGSGLLDLGGAGRGGGAFFCLLGRLGLELSPKGSAPKLFDIYRS